MDADRRGRQRRIAIGALVAAALSLAGLLLMREIEWVEESIDIGYAADARENPFLAAELFLEARGIESETVSGLALLDALPAPEDLLIVTSDRRTLSERRVRALVDWVEAGGSLWVLASEPWDVELGRSRDTLLDRLGVALLSHESEAGEAGEPLDEEEVSQSESAIEAETRTLRELLEQNLGGTLPRCEEDLERFARSTRPVEGADLVVALPAPESLALPERATLELDSPAGRQWAIVPRGAGRLIVTTSFEPFENRSIHCHDHAFVLWLAARGHPKVWLLHDVEMPGLASLLAGVFPLALGASGVWLLLLGASRSLRFALPPAAKRAVRRDWIEHLEAAAELQWHRDRGAAALRGLREDLAAQGHRFEPAPLRARRELVRAVRDAQVLATRAQRRQQPERSRR